MSAAGTQRAWLDAEIDRIWLMTEQRVRRYQEVGLRPAATDPSIAELEAILAARRYARAGASGVPYDPAELERADAAATELALALRASSPMADLAAALELRPLEVEALLVSLAPHVDPPLGDLLARLAGSSVSAVDLALVASLHQMRRDERLALLDVVDPERPLLRWRLVQVAGEDGPAGFGSAMRRAIRPTFDLLAFLAGRRDLAPQLAGCARMIPVRPPDDLELAPPQRQRLTRLAETARAAARGGALAALPWLVAWGGRGAGKLTMAKVLAESAGCPLLAFDPRAAGARLEDLLPLAQRDALVRSALLYVGPLREDQLATAGRDLARLMRGYPALAVFGVEALSPPVLDLEHPVEELALTAPGEAPRRALWERTIPAAARGEDLDLSTIARGYRLTPGEIEEVAATVVAPTRADPDRLVTRADLRAGLERRLRNDLGTLARPMEVTARWDELVLPPDVMGRIHELIARAQLTATVYDSWGLGRRLGYGKGLIALLSGPPGTGKTLLAGLIARELELELYQVDLAQVVSKWVGETEKQLGRVFDLAERAHAVLLFDEADALFARRTDVDHANDRYANLAVNYLLQRLEQYSGISVLTTNKDAVLDEALRRRLSLHVRLEVPEAAERERLWRSLLPARTPVAGEIEFAALADAYELTGGEIRNVVVRAAFLAAHADSPIDTAALARAAALELEDMGRLVRYEADDVYRSARVGAGGDAGLLPVDTDPPLEDFVEG